MQLKSHLYLLPCLSALTGRKIVSIYHFVYLLDIASKIAKDFIDNSIEVMLNWIKRRCKAAVSYSITGCVKLYIQNLNDSFGVTKSTTVHWGHVINSFSRV